MATTQTVGMIGLGVMGAAMAANLLKRGFTVVGYDVRPGPARTLAAQGGIATRSVAEVVRGSEVIFTSLPMPDAVLAVAAGIVSAKPKGRIVVETSTMTLATKEAARSRVEAAGATMLDCPISGAGAQARTGDIAFYASGPKAAYERCAPALDACARWRFHLGAFGAGSKMKFIANHLVAVHNVAAAEAMAMAQKAGIAPAAMLEAIRVGAGNSRGLEVRGPMMVADDYPPVTMTLKAFQKDLHLIGDFADEIGCPTPLFTLCRALYLAALSEGLHEEDIGAVCRVLERMAGVKRVSRRSRRRR
jgi:3-hydroxyisobutyrate dehydrogenase-like beta-hydroxyacid dehydrogenase